MKITMILFGTSLARCAAKGVAVSGLLEDIPTIRVSYETTVPAGSHLMEGALDAWHLANSEERYAEYRSIAAEARRSMAVGDVVIVEELGRKATFLCAAIGWVDITQGTPGGATTETIIKALDEELPGLDRMILAHYLARIIAPELAAA